MQPTRWRRGTWAAALVAGLVLRMLFVWNHPRFVGDTLVYGDLAHNLLARHVYGLSEGGAVRPTLIRLPGYPLFLAACFAVFGVGNYLAVVWVQVIADLLGCWLLGRVARRLFGERVGVVCLWMAALCPFTANYTAAALTETLSIFGVVVGFWGLVGWVEAVRVGGRGPSASLRRMGWAVVLGLGMCGAALLRPDGVLLAGVVLPAMGWVVWRGGLGAGGEGGLASRGGVGGTPRFRGGAAKEGGTRGVWPGPLLACAMLGGCLGGWAVRNWRVFHLVQPLAPKYANDPGEGAPLGFARWYRTWAVGLGDTTRVYWEYDGSVLSLGDLPGWAFDSAAERAETARVYADYNAETSSTPRIEEEFARLAAERVRAHPVRFYAVLPTARMGDMWLRPRTELLRRMPLDWWDVRVRPRAALFGWGYGGLNLGLLGVGVLGLVAWWRAGGRGWGAVAWAMVGFAVLRSGLLMTIDNSEPRYVLECYPVVVLFAALRVSEWLDGPRRGRVGA